MMNASHDMHIALLLQGILGDLIVGIAVLQPATRYLTNTCTSTSNRIGAERTLPLIVHSIGIHHTALERQ